MDFLVSANTDIGIAKSTNQDSLTVKIIDTTIGRMTFAVLCDGMGGLAKGEVASATLIKAFSKWAETQLPDVCMNGISDEIIREQWSSIVQQENEKIMNYGRIHNINLGTTVVVMLITQNRYYILNVGDSRAYEIKENVKQITEDQTLIQREISQGRLTEEEAKVDPRRSVLLQCIGASEVVSPAMYYGEVKLNATYMLCSDGFRHEITKEEIYEALNPEVLTDINIMDNNTKYLIEADKERQEKDNISVVLVRTF